jgi:hypothetical protein
MDFSSQPLIDQRWWRSGTDQFRIKIWDKNNNDTIVYDNQVTGDTLDAANPTTVIASGSIVIHNNKVEGNKW